jgi:hypothetical protein
MMISDDDRLRCECGAVLLPGFDPPGPYCRNCAPKHRKATEMKHG